MWNGLDESAADGAPDYSWVLTGQFDLGDPNLDFTEDEAYINNNVWTDFVNLTDSQKSTTYNAKWTCQQTASDPTAAAACLSIPSYLFNTCPEPPKTERFMQCVLEVENPYYQVHGQLLQAFLQAKKVLESDPANPVYVLIPNWQPTPLHQLRNSYLTQQHEMPNQANPGGCGAIDTMPCTVSETICWAPPFPDTSDPRNAMGFDAPGVPWLASLDPGFGTNCLHIYVGHPNVSYFTSGSPFDFQAWPLSPEVTYFGPVPSTTYLGSTLPFYAGRRTIWRGPGYQFDYGYENHGAQGLYDNVYGSIISGAADSYKQNFWQFRGLTTRIFTYDATWDFGWDILQIQNDREESCGSVVFYFGFTFSDWSATVTDIDNTAIDCSGEFNGLKVACRFQYSPTAAEIQQAITTGDMLTQSVELYYNGNDDGAADFFQYSIDQNGLADYGVSYEGKMKGDFLDSDGIVAYVQQYYQQNP